MVFCGNCGTQLNDGAKFCPKCAQPVDDSVSTPSQSQQQYDGGYEEEKMETWQKIVSVLVWPAGAILTISAFARKQTVLAKSALIYTIIGIVLSIAITSFLGNSDTDMLEKDVKNMMIETMKEKGVKMVVSDFVLVHQDGNDYVGLAKCTLDGERIDLNVKVVYDGSKYQAEWAPTEEYQAKEIKESLDELFGD